MQFRARVPVRAFARWLAPILGLLTVGVLGVRSAVPMLPQARAPSAAAASASAARVEASATRDSPSARARFLALATPRGASPSDRRIDELIRAARRLPGKSDVWIELGHAWVQKARESADPGYYLQANACAELALQIEPDHRLALNLRALVLLNDHEFARAKALAERILARTPDDASAWGTLSDALLELGDYDRAAEAVQKMLELKPNLPSYSRAAHIHWLSGKEEAAVELVRLAIDAAGEREPRAWALTQAATLFWQRGDCEGAAAGYELALTTFPDYAPALVGKGRALAARGQIDKAAELFERAFTRSPLVETAWLWGEALTLLGSAVAAEKAFSAAEHIGRQSDRRTLSFMYSSRNTHVHEALELAEAEWRARPDLQSDDALAWALYRNGRFADAKVAIDRARRLGTRDARLMYHQGAIHIALHELSEGRALVRAALAQNPSFDLSAVGEARALLATSAQ